MGLPVSDLIVFFRAMCDDNDLNLQEYSDQDIITNLRIAIVLMEGIWDHGNTVVLNNTDPENTYYEIVGNSDIPQWLIILYVLKAVIGTNAYRDLYSFDNGITKVTNVDQSKNKKTLKEFYDELIETRKNSVPGFSFNSFDDYFTRYYDIVDSISQGFH